MYRLFDKFIVFQNEDGEFEVANSDTTMVLQDKRTGKYVLQDIDEFAHFIKTVFPSKKEQKQLLKEIFCGEDNL